MEPALWELNEGNADEEVGVIVRLHQPDTLPPDVRVITRFGAIATIRLPRGKIVDIRQDEAVASMKAPELLTPGDEVPIEAEDFYTPSSASDNRRPLHHDDITGKGIIVGIVDWGCDFTHPNFRHANGTTRLLALWDQSAPYDAARPNRYGYGVIHSAQAINEALATDDPTATLSYFFARSDPTGSGTHGTHVLDIAAGNGRAGGPIGVAPEADLVFVHLHNRAFPAQVNLGDSVAVLEAADFILNIAQDRPVVMNFSMGRQMGPHDGSTLVEQGFDAIVTEQPGRAIVQSAGNYFDRSAHSSGQVLPGQIITIPFVVSPADITPNELEIWYPGRDVFTIAVRSPDGTRSKQTGLDDQSSIQVNGEAVCKIYHRAREPNNLDNNCRIYIEKGAPPGRWEVILTGVDVVDGRFNIWIERDATCPHCQSQFEHKYVVPLSTTGTICNGLRTIAVGAYNAHDPKRSLSRFSSSGPTRDGRRKPNLIAPGVQVLAARSGPHSFAGASDFLVRKSGTSMAAPHVTGAVALMFDLTNRVGQKLAINDTLNLLLGSTTAVEAEGDETYRIGNGMLDTDAALEATRDFLDKQLLDKPFGIPVPSEISNLPDASGRTVMNPNVHETVARETALESDWLETIESEINSQIPVQTHFNRILQRSGLQPISSLRDLFMMVARPGLISFRPQLARMFDAIAVPGGVPIRRLRPGDILLRYIPGERYIHIAFIHSHQLLPPAQATTQGWTLETMRPGYYGVVVEAGAFPHRAQQRYARRVLDARGTVPSNQLILRIRRSPIDKTVNDHLQSEGNDERVQSEDIDELWGLDDDAESILIEDIYENNPPPMTPTRPPMAVPPSDPAPFAPLPPAGSYWPIITNHRQGRTVSYTAEDGSIVGQAARRWLADRSGGTRYHIGIDLFANFGDPVVAIEDGEIVDFRPFCCGDRKTSNSLLVAHANVVANYGEVAPDSLRRNGLSVGSRVRAGQIIAYVGRNPGGSSMIHFETYAPGTRRTNRWLKNQPRPANVLNPTQYLLHLQEHGLVGPSSGSSVPTPPVSPSTSPTPGDRLPPVSTPLPVTPLTNWASLSPDERMRYVMDLLVREYLYPVNGAAGIVGNLWAESGLLPNRVEGSSMRTPMTAPDFNGRRVEFTAEQVMNRNRATRQGPRLPGVGLAQWTTSSRRAGLFLHTFQGRRLGADILYNMDAQVHYLVTELQTRYRRVDSLLRRANVSLEDASDEVLYNYEVPGSILSEPDAAGRRRKLPRHHPAVIRVFEQRRRYARNALRAYTSSAGSSSETDELLSIPDEESVLHQCRPGEGPPAAVPDPEGRGLHPLVYRGTGRLRSRNPTVGDAQQLLNRFLEQIRTSLDSCNVRTADVQRVISQGRATLQRSGQDPLIVDCRFGPSTETATKMFQACKGLVQDGKIGPLTWAELVKLRPSAPRVPPVIQPVILNPSNFPSSSGEPAPRPCCVLRPSIPILGNNIVELADLNRHLYGDPTAYPTREKSGLIYTCKGGFVDLGHSRDWADWTGFLAFRAKSMLTAGGTLSLSPEATGSSRTVQFIAQGTAPSDQVCILLAQRIAYEMAIWHEIITWFPASHQRYSAFSPEDNYSNLLGTYMGADALRNSKPFEDAVVDAIQDWLTRLKAQSGAETRQAFTAVQGRWWQNTLNPLADDAILRRHFDALGTVTPWLVPSFSPCRHETAFPLAVPETGPGGEVLSSLYRLELGVTSALPTAALAVTARGRTGGPITPNDFGSLIAFIRADAKSIFGSQADQP